MIEFDYIDWKEWKKVNGKNCGRPVNIALALASMNIPVFLVTCKRQSKSVTVGSLDV